MCSSKTKNWFQIQPRFGLWCTSVSPLASLVWFLVGTLAGVWWLTPEHLWMKQRQTRNGQRQEFVGIRMVLLCGFVRLSLCFEVAWSCQRWCHSFHLQPLLQVHKVATSRVNTKSKLGKKLTRQILQGSWSKKPKFRQKNIKKEIFTLWNSPGSVTLCKLAKTSRWFYQDQRLIPKAILNFLKEGEKERENNKRLIVKKVMWQSDMDLQEKGKKILGS